MGRGVREREESHVIQRVAPVLAAQLYMSVLVRGEGVCESVSVLEG